MNNLATCASARVEEATRVTVALPVEVVGDDLEGLSFFDNAQTVTISRHGATIKLKRRLVPDQYLTLVVKKPVQVRVLGRLAERADGCVYAVAFEKPSEPSLWDIEFPPVSEQAEAVVRTLLECCSSRTREVCCLNVLEAEVLQTQSNGLYSRAPL